MARESLRRVNRSPLHLSQLYSRLASPREHYSWLRAEAERRDACGSFLISCESECRYWPVCAVTTVAHVCTMRARRKLQFYLCNPCVPLLRAILLAFLAARPFPPCRDITTFLLEGMHTRLHSLLALTAETSRPSSSSYHSYGLGKQVRKRPRSDQNRYRDVKRRKVGSAERTSILVVVVVVGQICSNRFERIRISRAYQSFQVHEFLKLDKLFPEMCKSHNDI